MKETSTCLFIHLSSYAQVYNPPGFCNYYHPQTKFAKVMFSQVSVCPQGGGGFCPIACWDIPPGTRGRHPPGRHPPEQTPPWETPPGPEADTLPGRHPLCSACWDMVNKRAVHIPLECILVSSIELLLPREHTCFTSTHILNFTVLRIIFCHRNLPGKFNSSTHITSLNRF